MSDRIQVVAVSASLLLLVVVLELVRRRKLTEEYSFLWILSSIGVLVLSLRREPLETMARWLGVDYPQVVLLMLLILMVCVASLCFSVIVSRQRQQIERLIEETAILSAELRDLRTPQTGGRVVLDPPGEAGPEGPGLRSIAKSSTGVVARAAHDRG